MCFAPIPNAIRPLDQILRKSQFLWFSTFSIVGLATLTSEISTKRSTVGQQTIFSQTIIKKRPREKNVPLNSTYFGKLTIFCDFSHFPQNPTIPHFHFWVSVEYSIVIEISPTKKYATSALKRTFNHAHSPPRTKLSPRMLYFRNAILAKTHNSKKKNHLTKTLIFNMT